MSHRGNCWDNAVIEAFHSHLKTKECQYVKFNSMRLEEVREHVVLYMTYYNEVRIQAKIGYLTPTEFGSQAT